MHLTVDTNWFRVEGVGALRSEIYQLPGAMYQTLGPLYCPNHVVPDRNTSMTAHLGCKADLGRLL